MKVKILGPGCYRCILTEQNIRQVLEELKIDAEVEHVSQFADIWRHGVTATPAVIIDNKLMCQGRIPDLGEIRSWFKK